MIRNLISKATGSTSTSTQTLRIIQLPLPLRQRLILQHHWQRLLAPIYPAQRNLQDVTQSRCQYSTSAPIDNEISESDTSSPSFFPDRDRDPLEETLIEESLDYDLFESSAAPSGAAIAITENSEVLSTTNVENNRTILYPSLQKSDQYLSSLVSSNCSNTIAQIFEVYTSIPQEKLTVYHSSQALISLWDLQKYILSTSFDPEREFSNRERFNEQLSKSPEFKLIIEHIVQNCGQLADDPLISVLFCFKRTLSSGVKAEESQILIDEVITTRKETLSLSALAKLSICLRWEGLWGTLLMTQFYPLLHRYIQNLPGVGPSEIEDYTRFLSICIRNLARSITPTLFAEYCENLEQILDKFGQSWSPVTHAKIYLCILDCRLSLAPEKYYLYSTLLRKIGILLAPKISEMDLIESLSCLQKIIENGTGEPFSLNLAIQAKISRLIEESNAQSQNQSEIGDDGQNCTVNPPRLDLIQCIIPFIRRSSTVQRSRITSYLTDYIENYAHFDSISQILLKILKSVKTGDKSLYGKYWRKVGDKLIPMEGSEPRKVLRRTTDYLAFIYSRNYTFRHEGFENRGKKLLYFYLNNWLSGNQLPTLSTPSDIIKTYAFLIAVGQPLDPIFQERRHGLGKILSEKNIIGQARVPDLAILSRGINASIYQEHEHTDKNISENYYEQLNNYSSILENALLEKIEDEIEVGSKSNHGHGDRNLKTLSLLDLISIVKVPTLINRTCLDSPLFKKSIELLEKSLKPEHLDSKIAIDICHSLLGANYHSPKLFQTFTEYIQHIGKDNISLDFADKFISLGLFVGAEAQDSDSEEVFATCAKITSENWDKLGALSLLRSAIGMAYFNMLSLELVDRIFSIGFLNQVDDELLGSNSCGNYAQKVRQAFMELNRTVCLDLPQAGVPWFHEKYCQNLVAVNPCPPSAENHPILAEIQSALKEVLNESTDAIQASVHTPYFYLLNFLIEFDAKSGKPIKKKPTQSTTMKRLHLLQRNRNKNNAEPEVEPKSRVGIILLPPNAFTIGSTRTLKGHYKFRQRHLEILGYKVIFVDPQHWNSLCMSEPRAKANWIEEQIYNNNSNNNGNQNHHQQQQNSISQNLGSQNSSRNSEDLDFLV